MGKPIHPPKKKARQARNFPDHFSVTPSISGSKKTLATGDPKPVIQKPVIQKPVIQKPVIRLPLDLIGDDVPRLPTRVAADPSKGGVLMQSAGGELPPILPQIGFNIPVTTSLNFAGFDYWVKIG
ncbi:hypothetical protein OAF34_01135 [Pirellulaceae bacterium]|nr:hypothetical protein [Pirellulaceae bacterium]